MAECKLCNKHHLEFVKNYNSVISIIGDLDKKFYITKAQDFNLYVVNSQGGSEKSTLNEHFSNVIAAEQYISWQDFIVTEYGSGGQFHILKDNKKSTIYPKILPNKGYLQCVNFQNEKFYLTYPQSIIATDKAGCEPDFIIKDSRKFFLKSSVYENFLACICYVEGKYQLILYKDGIQTLSEPLERGFVPTYVCLSPVPSENDIAQLGVTICGNIKSKSYAIQYKISLS